MWWCNGQTRFPQLVWRCGPEWTHISAYTQKPFSQVSLELSLSFPSRFQPSLAVDAKMKGQGSELLAHVHKTVTNVRLWVYFWGERQNRSKVSQRRLMFSVKVHLVASVKISSYKQWCRHRLTFLFQHQWFVFITVLVIVVSNSHYLMLWFYHFVSTIIHNMLLCQHHTVTTPVPRCRCAIHCSSIHFIWETLFVFLLRSSGHSERWRPKWKEYSWSRRWLMWNNKYCKHFKWQYSIKKKLEKLKAWKQTNRSLCSLCRLGMKLLEVHVRRQRRDCGLIINIQNVMIIG